jgi:UDP-N-acetylglucosamine diphosphorylase/glucosamine-1-phosphate N-acetyltransferase
MKAVILAAGKGTRLYPLTITTPKILLPVLNKPMIHHFDEILEGIVDEIVIVIANNDYSKQIETYVNANKFLNKISFATQALNENSGTGDALQAARDKISVNEKFILLYGDDYYARQDLENLVKHEYAIVGKKVSDPEKWGILQQDGAGNLDKLVEKPQTFVGDIGNIGMYLLDSTIFELFENTAISQRGEFEVTDGVSLFAQHKKMKVLAVEGFWLPAGYPWMLLDAQEFLKDSVDYDIEGEIEENVHIKGKLKLGKGSVIKSGTYIEGNVVVGKNCVIGPNAYLRGTTSIGDNCKIGMSEVKNSIIMEGCALPHFNYFGDGVMGKNVNFAGGCTAANLRLDEENVKTMIKGKLVDTGRRKFSTVIGDNVKFGAKSIIYPGRKIWPNLTTLPGQVIDRDLME